MRRRPKLAGSASTHWCSPRSCEGEAREVARVHAAHREGNSTPRAGRSNARLRDLRRRNHGDACAAKDWAAAIRNSRWLPRSKSQACATIVILSAGTDGIDGPTDAAGAICDGTTLRARRSARPERSRNSSPTTTRIIFSKRLGDLVKTGPTGTNVADIQVDAGSRSLLVLHLQRRNGRLGRSRRSGREAARSGCQGTWSYRRRSPCEP